MTLQERSCAAFGSLMLSIGDESALLSPEGPLSAGELRVGQKVLGLLGGVPLFAEIVDTSRRTDTSERAYWICTSCGDLLIGEETEVVSGHGPVRGDYLWQGRNRDAIGWMDGEWPALETYVRNDHLGQTRGIESNLTIHVSKAARELASLGGHDPVYRLGLHGASELDDFAASVLGSEVACERGPAGWLWLKPTGRSLNGMSGSRSRPAHRPLAALWQKGEGPDNFTLPVTLARLRCLTMCLLGATGCGCSTTYRPRYMPLFVDLKISGERAPHASIQVVLERKSAPLVSLRLSKPGMYVVVNGLLCSGT